MTLIQLRYLVAIADAELNISLAAQKVNATQPGLSKQLKQLEEELGFQIFLRRGKSLDKLSEPGALVIEKARAALSEVENIRALAANHRQEGRGQLRIATTPTQDRFVLPPALLKLKRRYPDVSVHLSAASEADALAMVERDEADLAIVSTNDQPPSGDIVFPIFQWSRRIVVPRGHALTRLHRPITLADLAEHPLVTYESARLPSSAFAASFAAQDLSPNLACTTRDADTIKSCVRSGLGVGVLAEMAVGRSDVDLVSLPAAHLFGACTTWIALRRDRVQRNYLFELLSVLAAHLTRQQIKAILDSGADPQAAVIPTWSEGFAGDRADDSLSPLLRARLVVVNDDDQVSIVA